MAQYTLHVEAEGYAATADQLITVAPSGVTQPESADLTPVATIEGIANTQGSGGTNPYAGEIELLDSGGDVFATATSSATGAFSFELLPAAAGAAYTVRLQVAGHEPAQVAIAAGDLTLRETLDVGTLTALQHATATISVSTTPVPDGLTLAVTPSAGVSGAGASTTGSWSLTGLKAGTTYSFDITSTDYEDDDVPDYPATAGGTYAPAPVALVPRPATATISITNDPAPAGLSLAVTSSVVGDVVSGAGASTTGDWTVTGLESGATYDFEITSDDYETATVPSYTATPNGTYAPGAVTLVPKPATLAVSITNATPLAGLSLAVSPDSAAIAGDGASTDGTWEVTGLTAGTLYTVTITSTDYQTATFTHTPVANGSATQPAITLVGKPATATITVAGGAGTHVNANVTCSSGIVGVRGTGASANIWTFSIPVGQSCTFTATAPGFTADSSDAPYTATANGVYAETLTPTT
jgi:hypothetical protein